MEHEDDTGSNAGSWITAIIVLIVVGWFIHKAYDNYQNGEKKPFWKGTQQVQVCKKPYYSSQECYKLDVTLVDDETASIRFPNGGYKVTRDVTCYFASTYDAPKYVFCRSWDSDANQWDFMPTWVNY